MAELIELKDIEERVILLAVSTGEERDTQACLDELEELVKTAGAAAVDRMIQSRENIHPGTYLGKGKLEEVKERLRELDARGWSVTTSCPPPSCAAWRMPWIQKSWTEPW